MKKFLLFVMCSFLIAFVAKAQIQVKIVNPSFELPDGGEKIKDPNLMDGWHCDKTVDTDSGRESSATAPDGSMVGFSRNSDGRIYQAVDTLTASKTEYSFTLQSMVTWNPNPTGFCATYFSVMDKGANFLSRIVVDSLQTQIDAAGFIQIEHKYIFKDGHSYTGKVLLIEYGFKTDGTQDGWAGYDDLKLTKSSSTTGINEIIQSNIFNVYPNPASENCVLSVNSTKQVQFTLYTSNGKAIKSGNFTNSYSLDLAGLNKGMYLFKVNSEKGTETKKFVIK